jgi:D-alanyl-D-alanine carboxypeptidase/D-alanyl-D-alanine-endopeptidase (penicillin-binding protein 4)
MISCNKQSRTYRNLNNLILHTPGNPDVGVIVQSMQTGKILFQKNANRHFTPASTLKIVTATAALSFLGGNYQYTTQIYATNKISHGVLNGNLIIVFSGDPTLTSHNLSQLITKLRHIGLTRIQGNIFINNLIFDKIDAAPGWMWDDMNFCWSAPANAIMLNHNCFHFYLESGKNPGDKTTLLFANRLHYISIDNKTVTKSDKANLCPLTLTANNTNHYTLTGCATPDQSKLLMDVAIHNPTLYATKLITHLLQKNHIQLSGHILVGTTKQKSFFLVEHKSKPLRIIITTMLKNSDNLIANSLLRKIGAIYFQQQGNWRNGVNAVLLVLQQKTGIDPATFTMVDGAGISRYNMITPLQLSHILNYDYHNFSINPEFIVALPIAGVDGTLHKHHYTDHPGIYAVNPDIVGKLRAKTGTMKNVVSLAGFLQTKQGHILSVVIIINNFNGQYYPYRLLEAQITEYLAEHA